MERDVRDACEGRSGQCGVSVHPDNGTKTRRSKTLSERRKKPGCESSSSR
jgi:hypothetical protein